MANELRHADIGASMTQAEWEAIGTHIFNSQATGDILYASSGTQLSRLAVGSNDDMLMLKSGIPSWETSHGAGQHTNITSYLWLPAVAGYHVDGAATIQGVYGCVVSAGADTKITVCTTEALPDDFVSLTSVKALWKSPAAAGNLYWKLYGYYAADNESYITHTDVPAIGVTATQGTEKFNLQEPANPLTLASLAAGDFMGLYFQRDGTNAADTLDDLVHFFGLLFTYTANQ